jgi:hypothetical protein
MSVEILVTASIATASLLLAAWQAWTLRRSEQLRTQPIVLVGEQANPARVADGAPATVGLFVRNGGAGSAFGITFGALEGERRHRCKPSESGPSGPGNLPRVLASGARAPAGTGTFHFKFPFDLFVDGELAERVYWCRFENAFGQQWETRNSSAEDKPLEISRVSKWRSARDRQQAGGRALMRKRLLR